MKVSGDRLYDEAVGPRNPHRAGKMAAVRPWAHAAVPTRERHPCPAPESPVPVEATRMCHPHGRPIGDAGCPDCVAEYEARTVIPEGRNFCLIHRWYTGDCCPRCGAPPEDFGHVTSATELVAAVDERLARFQEEIA